MPKIETVFVRLTTGDENGAGTDGDVFVGLSGIGLFLDSRALNFNDFEQGDDRTYIIGKVPSVLPQPNPTKNKFGFNAPPSLVTTERLRLLPVYVRIQCGSEWQLKNINITVNPETDNIIYSALGGEHEDIWLGGDGFFGLGFILFLLPSNIGGG